MDKECIKCGSETEEIKSDEGYDAPGYINVQLYEIICNRCDHVETIV